MNRYIESDIESDTIRYRYSIGYSHRHKIRYILCTQTIDTTTESDTTTDIESDTDTIRVRYKISPTRARLINARTNYQCAKKLLSQCTFTYTANKVYTDWLPTMTENKGFYLNLCKQAKGELREAVRAVETGLGRENRV
jgi:outer membrane translocation and assembly module TamA